MASSVFVNQIFRIYSPERFVHICFFRFHCYTSQWQQLSIFFCLYFDSTDGEKKGSEVGERDSNLGRLQHSSVSECCPRGRRLQHKLASHVCYESFVDNWNKLTLSSHCFLHKWPTICYFHLHTLNFVHDFTKLVEMSFTNVIMSFKLCMVISHFYHSVSQPHIKSVSLWMQKYGVSKKKESEKDLIILKIQSKTLIKNDDNDETILRIQLPLSGHDSFCLGTLEKAVGVNGQVCFTQSPFSHPPW